MKIVSDLSLTSMKIGASGPVTPWNAPWASPISATSPAMVLDFAAGAYGAGSTLSSLPSLVNLARPSDATTINNSGLISVTGPNVHRLTYDPSTTARLGLLLENGAQNLLVDSGIPSTQTVTVASTSHMLSFYGSGSVTLSGAHVATLTGSGAYPAQTSISFTPSAGALTLTFSGSVSAAQLEEGTVVSSYIPTTGAAAVREADVATVGLGPWFNTNQGTIVFSGHLDGAAANDRILEIDSGTTTTRMSLLWNTVLSKPQFQVWDGGSLQTAIAPAGNAIGFGTPFRVAMAYGEDDFAVALNGGPVATDTNGTVPTGFSTLRLGRSVWGAQGLMTAESVTYYPSRLSNAELQALSA